MGAAHSTPAAGFVAGVARSYSLVLDFMNTEQLREEIEKNFPFIEKPEGKSISFHKDECLPCVDLRRELEAYDSKEIPPVAIRSLHQELSCLSGEGWRWVLPSYLRFCLTSEAAYNLFETEFLIYNLSPGIEYQPETIERLAALNTGKIKCLVSFLQWCQEHEPWSEYCPEQIEAGVKFLSALLLNRSVRIGRAGTPGSP